MDPWLGAMKSDFARQGQTKHDKSTELTEGNYVQKLSNMFALTTNYFKSHKQHFTRTTEEIQCIQTHLGKPIKEMKDTNKKNLSVEEFSRATREAIREEAAVTQKASKERLRWIKRQVSEIAKVAAKTQTQMNTISCNLSSAMAFIAVSTSRGNELLEKLFPQNTSSEKGNWDYAKTMRDGSIQASDT